jgi:hypothetical protein
MVLIGGMMVQGNKYRTGTFSKNLIIFYILLQRSNKKGSGMTTKLFFSFNLLEPGSEIWDPSWKNYGNEIKITNTQHF